MFYHCQITKQDDGWFYVVFPDMPNIQTTAKTHDDALAMAKDALNGILETDISRGMEIPAPKYNDGYPIYVDITIELAIQLRRLRGTQSQSDIAKKLGLSYQSYQRLENPRKSNPTVKTLEKISQCYKRQLAITL